MSKNEKANKPINTTPIRRLPSFDSLMSRNNIISQQPFFSSNSDEQEESELSGDDKRPSPSCCELL